MLGSKIILLNMSDIYLIRVFLLFIIEKHTYDNFMNNPLDNPARLPKPGFTQYRYIYDSHRISTNYACIHVSCTAKK